jgi:hypothetical protein
LTILQYNAITTIFQISSSSWHEFIAGGRIRRSISVFANLWRITVSTPAVIRCSFHAPRRWNSRISAAMTMSLADNLLQKQQKQREQDLWQSRIA